MTLENFRVFTSAKPETKDLVEQMKIVLANASTFYHAVHRFHWNVVGADFYEYHKFFDDIVSDVYDSLDPLAENIRKLGGEAPYLFSELEELSTIKVEKPSSNDPKVLVSALAAKNKEMIDCLKETFDIANKDNEQGVANFIAERIDMHQKWNWFLTSSLGK